MLFTGGDCKLSRKKDQLGAPAGKTADVFREPDVKTDGDSEPAQFGIEDAVVIPGREGVRFVEGELIFQVDIEHMDFAVAGKQITVPVKDIAGVKQFSLLRFRNASADDDHIVFRGPAGEGLKGLSVSGFGVLSEVFVAAETGEHFRQDHHGRSVESGLADHLFRADKSIALFPAGAELAYRQAKLAVAHFFLASSTLR